MRAARDAKVNLFPALLAHRHKTLGMLGSCISSLSVWSSSVQSLWRPHCWSPFFLPNGSFSHLGTAPFIYWSCSHDLDSKTCFRQPSLVRQTGRRSVEDVDFSNQRFTDCCRYCIG